MCIRDREYGVTTRTEKYWVIAYSALDSWVKREFTRLIWLQIVLVNNVDRKEEVKKMKTE